MIFDSYLYGNPETIAMRREEQRLRKERACGECRHRVSMVMLGQTVVTCAKSGKGTGRTYGKRCELFIRLVKVGKR